PILNRLAGENLGGAFTLAGAVLVTVIVVRLAWVLGYGVATRLASRVSPRMRRRTGEDIRGDLLIGWCGMRGLVTLAAAFALPAGFPGRDPILLAAFCVVLGTLVLQGMTLKPLI